MRLNLISSQRYVLIVGAIALACFVAGYLTAVLQSGIKTSSAWFSLEVALGVLVGVMVLVLRAAITERQQIENRLCKSEEQFRSMFEGAAIGIGLDNLQGQIVASNRALQSMLGYTREELRCMTFAEFTHPDDLAEDLKLFEEMIAGERDSYQMEKRHIRKNGQIVWVRLTNSLVRDEVGNPRFTIGMVEDIHERRRAEEALQQSEARFRVVAETAACAFLVYQGNHLRYVNPAAQAITEYSRAELLTMDFWQLAHPDFREIVRERGLARQQGDEVPSRYEIKILTKSGQVRWVDFRAGLITFGGKPAGMATAYDITDRKHAEAQLQLAADRERLLSEMALRIRRSLNLEEILHTTVEEIRQFLQTDRVFIGALEETHRCRIVAESFGSEWASPIDWQATPEQVAEMQALLERDRLRVMNDTEEMENPAFLVEYYRRANIRACIVVPLMLDDGRMFGVLIVNNCSQPRQWQSFEIDLLQQLATQVEIAIQQAQLYQQVKSLASNLECQVEQRTAELQQRMQELHNSNQVKDLLLHAVAHDLKTPVQGILMVLNRLRHKCEDTVPISRHMLECMLQSSDHQLRLLNSLLENHTINEPKLQLNCEPIHLSKIIQPTLETLKSFLENNQATVLNQIPEDLLPVEADSAMLQQVFQSLLINAVKHNPPGITIALSAKLFDATPETSSNCSYTNASQPNTQMVYCMVEDDGVGIRQDQCDRLFQLYARGLDNCHLTGIGLGLNQCRQIITAHGGQVGVVSHPGSGAKFWFTLPVSIGTRD